MSQAAERVEDWIGSSESAGDVVAAAPADRLAATLGRGDAPLAPGDPLPEGRHWLYFLPATPRADLGPDGHAARGGFLPPIDLPRRMWAGGRLAFRRPLRVGETARRDSEVAAITPKRGRSGALVFVAVRHAISGEDGPAIDERQDIVYRASPRPGAPEPAPVPPPADAAWRRTVTVDPVLLFRFSALTFNAHRIHFDRDYATGAEGYPGLVVHGPLTAILLMDLVRDETGRALAGFEYQAVAPLFDTAPFAVCGAPAGADTATLWAETPAGAVAMKGTATLAD